MVRGISGRLAVIAVVAILFCHLLGSVACAWWDDKWQYKKKIQLNSSQSGADVAESLSEVPVLIRLHSGNFSFANAKEDGSDIRFLSADEKIPLKYHIETYDPLLEIALVWVNVPRIAGSSNTDSVWLYYGNKNAPGTENRGGTFDVNHLVVYHLDEKDGPPKDSTAYGNNASQFEGGSKAQAVIGTGAAFVGGGERIVIPRSPSFNLSGGFTFSAWINMGAPQNDGRLFSWQDEHQSLIVGIDAAKPYGRIITETGETVSTEKNFDLTPDGWHHIALTAKPGGKMVLFVDGAEVSSVNSPAKLPEPAADMTVGATFKGENPYAGEMDEVRIYKTSLSPGWVKVAFKGESPDTTLYAFADEEINESGDSTAIYLRAIIKHISFDAWIIIGSLIIFGLISTMAFLLKAIALSVMRRQNAAFSERFSRLADFETFAEDEDGYQNSSVYRIYLAGRSELKRWLPPVNDSPAEPVFLKEKAFKAVAAALNRAFVTEQVKLSSGLVVLAMAISGAPFIGLLGTVWGVMITFAGMAEAGEANLMAIAPGIASALVATIFGLLVAIPSLFAYNFLVSQVKAMSTMVRVFVDEFTARVEASYGGE